MHEMSIVASLFEILEGKARENQATKIVGVRLKVGKLAGVVPEFLLQLVANLVVAHQVVEVDG